MRVLLTGANSFVGRTVAETLSQEGHEVAGTYRSDDGRLEPLKALDNFSLFRVELAQISSFDTLPQSFDAVIHCAAASSHVGLSYDEYISGNVLSTSNTAQFARSAGARKFVFLSTLSVHGDIEDTEVTAATPSRNPNLYGISKLFCERLLFDQADDLPSIAIRLPAVLGRGAHRSWLPGLADRINRKLPISIYNASAPFNNAVLASDVSKFCSHLLKQDLVGHAALPIAASGLIKIRDVIRLMFEGMETTVEVTEHPAPGKSFIVSSREAIDGYGYAPSHIEDIVVQFAQSARFST